MPEWKREGTDRDFERISFGREGEKVRGTGGICGKSSRTEMASLARDRKRETSLKTGSLHKAGAKES